MSKGQVPGEAGPAFESWFRARFHEVDALGHVNNAAYLNYIEQAAIDHATFLGLDMERLQALGGMFVAHRHEIVFHRPVYAGDLLRVVTWLEEPVGARVTRQYRVFREHDPAGAPPLTGRAVEDAAPRAGSELAVTATTEWVFAAPSGRPRRIPAEMASLFRAGARLAPGEPAR